HSNFILQKNTIKIDNDILNQSKLGYETSVVMGESIGIKNKKVCHFSHYYF
ncbi:phosphatidylserine decarboxylase, partial [Clostridium botulinum CFSAN002369]